MLPILVAGVLNQNGFATWKWDGNGWLVLRPAHCPAFPASNPVFYPAMRMTIMVAGPTGGPYQTWGWDGKDWHRVPVVGDPISGIPQGLVYDATRDRLLLTSNEYPPALATWTFDGTRWMRATTPAPRPRQRAGLAYDPRSRVVFLQGGVVPAGSDPVTKPGDGMVVPGSN